MICTKRKKDSEAEKDITTQNQLLLAGFHAVYVFDLSQTEGASFPTSKSLSRVKLDSTANG
jgi:hypothetical protein